MGGKDNKPSPWTAWYLEWLLLNIHLHCLVLDGVYHTTEGLPVFHAVRAPTAEQLQTLLPRIIKRLMKFLTRKGFRYGKLLALRRYLDDHRRHRASRRGRQDLHASGLVRPGIPPSSGASLRSIPTGRTDLRSHPIQPLSRPCPLDVARPSRQNAPKNIAPRAEEGPENAPILDRWIVSLTTHRSIGTLPLAEKAFEIPYTCATGMCPIILRTQMFEGWSKAKTALFAFRRRKALDVLFQRSVRD